MKQPITHQRRENDFWPDRWDPYRRRDEVMHLFDERVANRLLSFADFVPGEYDCWACGCIDAPEEIPLGGTARIVTVGGYERESYLRLSRYWDSWADHQRAAHETARMIKQLLAEQEAEEEKHHEC